MKITKVEIDEERTYHSVTLYNGDVVKVDRTRDAFFTTDKREIRLNLHLYRLKGKWFPSQVYHEADIKVNCPFCHTTDIVCRYFKDKESELFDEIMNHPTVRLREIFNKKV